MRVAAHDHVGQVALFKLQLSDAERAVAVRHTLPNTQFRDSHTVPFLRVQYKVSHV